MKKVESRNFHRNKKNIKSKNGNILAPESWKCVLLQTITALHSYVISLYNRKKIFLKSHVVWFFYK